MQQMGEKASLAAAGNCKQRRNWEAGGGWKGRPSPVVWPAGWRARCVAPIAPRELTSSGEGEVAGGRCPDTGDASMTGVPRSGVVRYEAGAWPAAYRKHAAR